MKATLKDAVFGLAVGDALGLPVQFRRRDSYRIEGMTGCGTYHMPVGTWSDDTSLTLACCDSIRLKGAVDTADMRRRFENWLEKGAYTPFGRAFDAGRTCVTAIKGRMGCSDEWSNGNGSLMRIIPLAFVEGITDGQIREVSAVTHAHRCAKECCVVYVHIARRLLQGHSLEAALWCLLNTDNYRDAMLLAVNLGDDTDTVAAIAGALAGILYGFEAIPAEWLAALQKKELLEEVLW